MIPTKAYILRINDPISIAYADVCAKSCKDIGLEYEFFEGYSGITQEELWLNQLPLKLNVYHRMDNGAACATAGHFMIWKKIADNKECAIILEHDALMLHRVDVDIPDNMIVALGYKLYDKYKYDHVRAGPPVNVYKINHHCGAHAYAITWNTAELLLSELHTIGVREAIDNMYFMRNVISSLIPLGIMNPTPVIGWLRKSTIWNTSAEMNYPFIPSFAENYK